MDYLDNNHMNVGWCRQCQIRNRCQKVLHLTIDCAILTVVLFLVQDPEESLPIVYPGGNSGECTEKVRRKLFTRNVPKKEKGSNQMSQGSGSNQECEGVLQTVLLEASPRRHACITPVHFATAFVVFCQDMRRLLSASSVTSP